MESLYLDCGMGVAGDIFMAALLELHPSPDNFMERLNHLEIPGIEVKREEVTKYGIEGTHIKVLYKGHEKTSYDANLNKSFHTEEETIAHINIKELLESLPLSQKTLENIKAVLNLIFEAERIVHQMPLGDIRASRFETIKAFVDITGSCMLLEELAFGQILASPIHVGKGQIKGKFGLLPIPSPATAYILRNIPHYKGDIIGELCTSTGAALMRHFVDDFVPFSNMKISKIGYGIGATDFKISSCLRAICGGSY